MKKTRRGSFWGLLMAGLAFLVMTSKSTVAAELVHFKQLLPFVEVKLPDWKMSGKPSGTTLKYQNMNLSEATATYQSGDKTMEISIMDFVGKNMPWAAKIPQMQIESTEEYLRPINIGGFKALELYTYQTKKGEVNINVDNRFWVKLEGKKLDNTEPLKAAAQQMDLKKLAELAK